MKLFKKFLNLFKKSRWQKITSGTIIVPKGVETVSIKIIGKCQHEPIIQFMAPPFECKKCGEYFR